MNILPVLKDYSEVCSVLAKQTKCIRCKENICTAAFTPKEKQAFLTTAAYTLVCDLCLKDHEKSSFVQCSDAETCAEFGIYIFGNHQSRVANIKIFISQAASLLSMNPYDASIQKQQFTVGTIMSVDDALAAFLTWDRIRRSQSTLPPAISVGWGSEKVRIPEDDWEQQARDQEYRAFQRQNYEVWRKNMEVMPTRWGDQTPVDTAWGVPNLSSSAWGALSPSFMSHSTSMPEKKQKHKK